jgi:hypothetical protein
MTEHEHDQPDDVPTGDLIDHGPGKRQPDRGDLEAARQSLKPGPRMDSEISGAGAGMTGSVGPASNMRRPPGRGGENLDRDEDPRDPRD